LILATEWWAERAGVVEGSAAAIAFLQHRLKLLGIAGAQGDAEVGQRLL